MTIKKDNNKLSRKDWTLKNLEDGGKLSHFPKDIKEKMKKEYTSK